MLEGVIVSRTRSALVLVALSSWVLPSLASAQTTVQGQIIIQEATPTTSAAPPQGQVYVVPQSDYITPPMAAQPQCPAGASVEMDRWGRPVCMMEVQRHRVIGGLLGGGIGLLAGGWVVSWVSGIVVTVGGAFACFVPSGCGWTSSGASSAFFNWGWAPLIGPWVQMGYLWDNADGGMYAWLAVEGLLQAGGLVMLIFGALGEDSIQLEPVPGYAVHVRPMISASTQGLSADVRF